VNKPHYRTGWRFFGWQTTRADYAADAATGLLLRRPPAGGGDPAGSLCADGETASAAAIRLAVSLRGSYLPCRDPPGTGKTYTAAEQILELIARGRTVGITGPSHAVIHHLIGKVYEHVRRLVPGGRARSACT
jgi:hypothetical protein